MASRGAGIWIKWIIVPAALAALGYFLVGPRIGGPIAERLSGPPAAEKPIQHSAAPSNDKPLRGDLPAPQVDVDVSPVNERRTERPRHRRRRARKPTVSHTRVRDVNPPDDGGSSGGATTGGDTGGTDGGGTNGR